MDIPKIKDVRGNLSVVEGDFLPFATKRVYYLYDVPSGAMRGGHAHKQLYQFLIAVSGSFDVVIKDGKNAKTIPLNRPDRGLLIVPGIWRELTNFSSGSVCVVIASELYVEEDYVYDYQYFVKLKKTDNL